MKTFGNVASLIVGMSRIGFILLAQRTYQQGWSDRAVAPTASSADISSAAPSVAASAETIVMK